MAQRRWKCAMSAFELTDTHFLSFDSCLGGILGCLACFFARHCHKRAVVAHGYQTYLFGAQMALGYQESGYVATRYLLLLACVEVKCGHARFDRIRIISGGCIGAAEGYVRWNGVSFGCYHIYRA